MSEKGKTVINNWNFGSFFGTFPSVRFLLRFLLGMMILMGVINIIAGDFQENRKVYGTCVDACKAPTGEHTLKAFDREFVDVTNGDIRAIPSCVDSCNEMYLVLRRFRK